MGFGWVLIGFEVDFDFDFDFDSDSDGVWILIFCYEFLFFGLWILTGLGLARIGGLV